MLAQSRVRDNSQPLGTNEMKRILMIKPLKPDIRITHHSFKNADRSRRTIGGI